MEEKEGWKKRRMCYPPIFQSSGYPFCEEGWKKGKDPNLPTFQKSDASMRGCIHVRCVATGRVPSVRHPLQRVSRRWHPQF